jgi:hypothetical protein
MIATPYVCVVYLTLGIFYFGVSVLFDLFYLTVTLYKYYVP